MAVDPGADATIVARVRAAGAILLGKSNTPEFTLGGGGKGKGAFAARAFVPPGDYRAVLTVNGQEYGASGSQKKMMKSMRPSATPAPTC